MACALAAVSVPSTKGASLQVLCSHRSAADRIAAAPARQSVAGIPRWSCLRAMPLDIGTRAPTLTSSKRFKRAESKYLGNASHSGTISANNGSGADVSAGTTSSAAGVSPGTAGAVSLVVAIGIPVLAGMFVSSFNKSTSDWYQSLKKPSWNPPDAVFGAVWSFLYAAMGYSAWLVWRNGGWEAQSGPLTVYAVQLVLNLLWPVLCFGAQSLFWSLIDIVLLLFAVYNTIQAFHPIDEFAAQLLWPYFGWVVFAAVLNFSLWRENRRRPPPSGTIAGAQGYAT